MGKQEKSVKTVGDPVETQTEYLQNTSLGSYRYTNPLDTMRKLWCSLLEL
jgi:hypothetical protein